MRVVFLFGPPASGKFTIGKLVADELGIPLFHNHLCVDLASTLFEFGSESFVRLREKVWMASFEEAAKCGTSFVFTFSPESTVLDGMIGRLEKVVLKHGGRIDFIELQCASDEILARVSNPERAEYGKLVDPNLFEDLRSSGAFEYEMNCDPMLSVNTTDMAPDKCAKLIVGALQ